jgi:hypothetical protein
MECGLKPLEELGLVKGAMIEKVYACDVINNRFPLVAGFRFAHLRNDKNPFLE